MSAIDRAVRDRRIMLAVALAAVLTASLLHAADSNDEEAQLLAVLKQETALATKTRMNSDYVPGIVSILQGDRLRALGARTVWDALAYVPGVQPMLDGTGTPSVSVRGIPFPFNSGSIQILLNSDPVWTEQAGLNGSVLLLPMSQVERIEFIRGPGSVLYGDFAFQGLINIITRKRGEQVGGAVDSHGGRDADLLLSGERGGWNSSVNLAAKTDNDAILPEGESADENRFSGIADVKYGGFSLQSQIVDRHVHAADAQTAVAARGETDWSSAGRYRAQWSNALSFELHTRYLYNNVATTANSFKGNQLDSGADLHWSGWAHQNWLAGIAYSDDSIDRALATLPPPPNLPPGQAPPSLTISGRHRDVTSVYLQDEIELSPRLRATVGARYDDNSQIGQRLTPRAAVVWQAAEHHILKLQYSEGFRAPTFFEVYGSGAFNPDLDFEVNRTVEFNYVYERPDLTLRATLYRTRIENMVFIDLVRQAFGNVASAKADGAEFELSQRLGGDWRVDANLSYVDSRDNRDLPQLAPQAIAEVPHWMGNLGLLWNPSPDLTCGLHWNHVGERPGAGTAGGSYDLVDASMTRRRFLDPRLDLQLSVDNLFDRRVLELQPGPFGDMQFPYRDRIAWARLRWRW
jgi:iron complex outermembrane receptor protein